MFLVLNINEEVNNIQASGEANPFYFVFHCFNSLQDFSYSIRNVDGEGEKKCFIESNATWSTLTPWLQGFLASTTAS